MRELGDRGSRKKSFYIVPYSGLVLTLSLRVFATSNVYNVYSGLGRLEEYNNRLKSRDVKSRATYNSGTVEAHMDRQARYAGTPTSNKRNLQVIEVRKAELPFYMGSCPSLAPHIVFAVDLRSPTLYFRRVEPKEIAPFAVLVA